MIGYNFPYPVEVPANLCCDNSWLCEKHYEQSRVWAEKNYPWSVRDAWRDLVSKGIIKL